MTPARMTLETLAKPLLLLSTLLAATLPLAAASPAPAPLDQPTVHLQPTNLQGPRPLAPQTRDAVVRDYLEAWQSMRQAFDTNHPELLDTDFVGAAHDKLGATVKEQASLSLRTRYQDHAHDLRIAFYSPEGLSIELVDEVDYDVQLFDHDKLLSTQRVQTRYLVVMTPAEVRWRVRVLQATPE